jgi:hypothetical protein
VPARPAGRPSLRLCDVDANGRRVPGRVDTVGVPKTLNA